MALTYYNIVAGADPHAGATSYSSSIVVTSSDSYHHPTSDNITGASGETFRNESTAYTSGRNSAYGLSAFSSYSTTIYDANTNGQFSGSSSGSYQDVEGATYLNGNYTFTRSAIGAYIVINRNT